MNKQVQETSEVIEETQPELLAHISFPNMLNFYIIHSTTDCEIINEDLK